MLRKDVPSFHRALAVHVTKSASHGVAEIGIAESVHYGSEARTELGEEYWEESQLGGQLDQVEYGEDCHYCVRCPAHEECRHQGDADLQTISECNGGTWNILAAMWVGFCGLGRTGLSGFRPTNSLDLCYPMSRASWRDFEIGSIKGPQRLL